MVWASVGLALLGSNSPTGVLSTYLYVFLYSLLNKELFPSIAASDNVVISKLFLHHLSQLLSLSVSQLIDVFHLKKAQKQRIVAIRK